MDELFYPLIAFILLAGYGLVYFGVQRYNRQAIVFLYQEITFIDYDINLLRIKINNFLAQDSSLKYLVVDQLDKLDAAAKVLNLARNLSSDKKPYLMKRLILQAKDIVADVQYFVEQATLARQSA